ncbi:protein Cep89 homolog [Drosophila sechellia]|uniref:protein Cep89 homolog n=1 Tax=Drosophila sechellia TaxID=7238 RepID=UPI0013DE0AED|nr:protein Cep89 homolog [Drosophila sechellia]
MSTRNVMITDLDQPDPEQQQHHQNPKKNRKVLQTLSGNFNRRSRSVEVEVKRQDNLGVVHKDRKKDRSFNSLLQAKDQQLEQLVQRLATLHRYNDQFAKENDQLRKDSGQLEQRLSEAEQQVANCTRCQQLGHRLDTVLGQNRTLAGDVDMLKTLVFRLNVQIESYQDQRRLGEGAPTCGGSAKVSSSSAPYPPLPTHTLGPLLQAYDESLRDKDALLAQYKTEFEHFTGELKRALEENTKLLQSQEQLRRDLGGWREERVCLQAQLGVCRSKAEAQTRKTDLAKEKLVEVMHCYEQRMQTLLLDMDHLQAAYARTKSELAALKSASSAAPAAVAPPLPSESDALHQCKALLEQLRQEHARERTALQEQLQATTARAASLVRSTEKAKHSRDRLKARLRMALQWAQKLEAGQAEVRDTYEAVRRLEVLVQHKESQLRGLHARNAEEMDKLRHKLQQKEETICALLRGKMERRPAVD